MVHESSACTLPRSICWSGDGHRNRSYGLMYMDAGLVVLRGVNTPGKNSKGSFICSENAGFVQAGAITSLSTKKNSHHALLDFRTERSRDYRTLFCESTADQKPTQRVVGCVISRVGLGGAHPELQPFVMLYLLYIAVLQRT